MSLINEALKQAERDKRRSLDDADRMAELEPIDDDGRRGMTMIFEDVTHEKVTEMVIPSRKFAAFLQAVNGGQERFRGLL